MLKIMGVDPGIVNVGLAALEVCIEENRPFKLVYADTILGVHNDYGLIDDGQKTMAAEGLTRSYSQALKVIDPDFVGCEDNFLGLSPSSFKRLIEVVSYFRLHTSQVSKVIWFKLVLPRLAKQIVGADFRGATKDDVTKGLKTCSFLDLNGIDPDNLTEHANDAILIALYFAVQYYKDLGRDVLNGKETDHIGKSVRPV